MKFVDFKVGMKDQTRKTITEADVVLFSAVSTDINPLHLSEEAAKNGIFKKRVAHGILVSGLISAVLGNKLPGPGTVYLGQELRFVAPVYIGDDICAEAEIIEIRPEKRIIKLQTTCTNQRGEKVITGVATVMFND